MLRAKILNHMNKVINRTFRNFFKRFISIKIKNYVCQEIAEAFLVVKLRQRER